MKIFFKLISIIFIIAISIFIGHENPEVVDKSKKFVKYYLKKIGVVKTFQLDIKNSKEPLIQTNVNQQDYFGNSFSLELNKFLTLNGKTAGLIFHNDEDFVVFMQNGKKILKNKVEEINIPLNFTTEKEGGVRSIFSINKKYFALISRKKLNCYYASLIRLFDQNEVFNSKCIVDQDNVNFAGIGGAYIFEKDDLLLAIGTPTHDSDKIDLLAQSKDSIFGKIFKFKTKDLLNKNTMSDFEFYSIGHRNPQGMIKIKNDIYATEHGPQGGDELNIIFENKNYGWPIVSLGTRYGGKSYIRKDMTGNFIEPIFSFLPAIAPSDLNECPDNLKIYYKEYDCLIGLSLKEMSIIIYLIDSKNNKLINYEKILLDKRLRNFGVSPDGKLFLDKKNYFYVTSDKDGIYKLKFKDFR